MIANKVDDMLNYIEEEYSRFQKPITGNEIVSEFQSTWSVSIQTVVRTLLDKEEEIDELESVRVTKKSVGSSYEVYAFKWVER